MVLSLGADHKESWFRVELGFVRIRTFLGQVETPFVLSLVFREAVENGHLEWRFLVHSICN